MVKTQTSVLIVEDDDAVRRLCDDIVTSLGYLSMPAASLEEGRAILTKRKPHLVLLDLRLPDGDGADLLPEIKEKYPNTHVIIMTAYGTIRSAVEAIRRGAFDYLTKPFSTRDMMMLLREAAEKKVQKAGELPEESVLASEGFHSLLGTSGGMQEIYRLILKIADVDSTVLIQGESGTGKELVARAIHATAATAGEPFIPIDCNILNENVIESELFGHVKGAFTGASRDREGLFKVAGKGTVFLDEISDIPLEIQTKLLRAIQERDMKPVGSTKTVKFEARIVAATQRDLEAETKRGRFREDLFYRLNVIPISIPPLRYRKDDIPVLVQHFVRTFTMGKRPERTIADATMSALQAYDWPGNVRELENCIEQVVALSSSPVIDVEDLPVRITRREPVESEEGEGQTLQKAKPLRELEQEAILAALRETRGNRRQAARLLGIAESTLYAKLKEMKEQDRIP